jgi:hypothetical protein
MTVAIPPAPVPANQADLMRAVEQFEAKCGKLFIFLLRIKLHAVFPSRLRAGPSRITLSCIRPSSSGSDLWLTVRQIGILASISFDGNVVITVMPPGFGLRSWKGAQRCSG